VLAFRGGETRAPLIVKRADALSRLHLWRWRAGTRIGTERLSTRLDRRLRRSGGGRSLSLWKVAGLAPDGTARDRRKPFPRPLPLSRSANLPDACEADRRRRRRGRQLRARKPRAGRGASIPAYCRVRVGRTTTARSIRQPPTLAARTSRAAGQVRHLPTVTGSRRKLLRRLANTRPIPVCP
jgi:hypothetical protein